MVLRTPTQRELARLVTRTPRTAGRFAPRRELDQEELIAFKDNVHELTTLTRRMRRLLARRRAGAEKLLVKTAASWVRQERYEPAVAAFEWIARIRATPGKREQIGGLEEKFLGVLKRHAPKERLPQMLVKVLQGHKKTNQLTFDRIRIALMKMRDADIRARGEPFEGPTGSTRKTAAASLDAADALK